MRYKIIKKVRRHNENVFEHYYIQKEVKPWYSKKMKWKYIWTTDYVGHHRVHFGDLKGAEDFIKKMIEADNRDYNTEDVKIIETRESTIDKLLTDE